MVLIRLLEHKSLFRSGQRVKPESGDVSPTPRSDEGPSDQGRKECQNSLCCKKEVKTRGKKVF